MKDFKKYYIIKATPDLLLFSPYQSLIIKLWSGDEAEMSIIPNTEFSFWEGNAAKN